MRHILVGGCAASPERRTWAKRGADDGKCDEFGGLKQERVPEDGKNGINGIGSGRTLETPTNSNTNDNKAKGSECG